MTLLRVAATAFPMLPVSSAAVWSERFTGACAFAKDGGAHLVVFPEYVTAPLLTIDRDWQCWTATWLETAIAAARSLKLHVLAGTHLVNESGALRNRAVLVAPDGACVFQDKLHPTPWERSWGLAPTSQLTLYTIADVRIAILICYDIEFPELARAATKAGAEVLLVPSWTDDRQGFHRVRRCAAARCVEDVVYVVHAPVVGGLPNISGFEQACGEAGILTPCDTAFARDGVAAAGGWNTAETVLADLDLSNLRAARSTGTVTPLADARAEHDYRINSTPSSVVPPSSGMVRRH
jgi:predicted amidohydrolase